MSNDLLLISDTIGYIFGSIFNTLSNVYLGDFSLLTIFASFLFLDLVMWFVFSVFGQQYRRDNEQVRNDGVRKKGV